MKILKNKNHTNMYQIHTKMYSCIDVVVEMTFYMGKLYIIISGFVYKFVYL